MLKDSFYCSRGGANRLPPIIYNKKSPKSLILKGIWGDYGDLSFSYAVKLTREIAIWK